MPHVADSLIHATARILTEGPAGTGSGTGFFVELCKSDTGSVLVLITNKHVIQGATKGRIVFKEGKATDGDPVPDRSHTFEIANFEQGWVLHQDPDVDLAALPVGPMVHAAASQGFDLYIRAFEPEVIADESFLSDLSAIEDVFMLGYPNGLWDEKHNLPLVRRGVTASPPGVRHNGREEFVIDCACFPGSSGSPVILFDRFGHTDKNGTTFMGGWRLRLIGVLYAGPQFTAEGEIVVTPVPTAVRATAISRIPMNLGYCIRADQIMWFDEHFRAGCALEATVRA